MVTFIGVGMGLDDPGLVTAVRFAMELVGRLDPAFAVGGDAR